MEGMDNLINAMSNEKLEALKVEYSDQPSVATLIDGILETRAKAEEQAKAKLDFVKTIDKLVAKLPHPDDVHNVYLHWGEVEVEVGEPEAVEVTDDEGNKTTELRIPKVKEFQWIVEVNHATKGGGTTTKADGNGKTRAKAIMVDLDGNHIGNFRSGEEACKHLGYETRGDSGNRVLREARSNNPHYYTVKPYEGTDFTIK